MPRKSCLLSRDPPPCNCILRHLSALLDKALGLQPGSARSGGLALLSASPSMPFDPPPGLAAPGSDGWARLEPPWEAHVHSRRSRGLGPHGSLVHTRSFRHLTPRPPRSPPIFTPALCLSCRALQARVEFTAPSQLPSGFRVWPLTLSPPQPGPWGRCPCGGSHLTVGATKSH